MIWPAWTKMRYHRTPGKEGQVMSSTHAVTWLKASRRKKSECEKRWKKWHQGCDRREGKHLISASFWERRPREAWNSWWLTFRAPGWDFCTIFSILKKTLFMGEKKDPQAEQNILDAAAMIQWQRQREKPSLKSALERSPDETWIQRLVSRLGNKCTQKHYTVLILLGKWFAKWKIKENKTKKGKSKLWTCTLLTLDSGNMHLESLLRTVCL